MSYFCVAFIKNLLSFLPITILIVVRSRFSPGPESRQSAVGKCPKQSLYQKINWTVLQRGADTGVLNTWLMESAHRCVHLQ